MNTDTFHNILKENFADKNLSALSRELDIPRSVLQDWIQEKRQPSMKNLTYVKKIADYLGMSLDDLLIGHPPKRKIISSVTFEDDGKKYQVLIQKI